MSASQNYNVNLNINANAQSAQQQLQKLQQQLQQIANMKVTVGTDVLKKDIEEASEAALKLSSHLQQAINAQTGNLDFTRLNESLKKSNINILKYGESLQKLGPAGQKAFIGLAESIAKSEIPLRRTSQLTQKMWDGFKRTAGWQLQSSLIHGIVGSVQQAVGYAKDLNKSLTDIRIVTGSSADEMARFAQRANDAAKKLSTTTTDYTRASLIYYQQGLNDAEVKARTEATIKMANATGTSAQQVSDQMTAIWNNYANGSKQLTHYADVMTALGAATASSTDEIAQGLQKFASISNTVGLSYEYAASALATITAESRESADVVGNALKTLFSRIQGLQLGETLDDGTTLNKYSTALAKVGISIKDQAGELKDMDDILNEMGSKWDTLARDEKMALAQTVAGVRQYTQLMTLMENWDDFKTNLNTAQNSTGTLDKQAAIYAESWEAASKRVRASWEGLWDNLINSDSFITILDGLSSVIELIDQMVSGFGGAGGVLLSFGGILTKVFNKQITQGLKDLTYSMKMLNPNYSKKLMSERNTLVNGLIGSMKSGHMEGLGQVESKIRSDGMKTQAEMTRLLLNRTAPLSQEQQLFEQHYSKLLNENQEARNINAQKQDALKTKIGDTVTDKIYGNRFKIYKQGPDGKFISNKDEGLNAAYISSNVSAEAGMDRRAYFQGLAKENAKIISEMNNAGTTDSMVKAIGKLSDTEQALIQERRAQLENTGLDDKAVKSALGKYIQNDILKGRVGSAVGGMKLSGAELNLSAEEQEKYRAAYQEYTDELTKLELEEKDEKVLNRKKNQLFKKYKKAISGEEENKIGGTEAVVSGAMGAMQALAAGESLKALINSFEDGTATLTSSLTSITSVAMSGAMGVQGLTKAIGAIPGVSAASAGWIGLAVTAALAAISVLSDAIDKSSTSRKELATNLVSSNNELASSTKTTSNAVEQYKTQNNSYLDSINKIKSLSYDPSNMAEDIYQANKQALELIEQYGLTGNDYTSNAQGLIEIDNRVLNAKVKEQEQYAKSADYAEILGKSLNNSNNERLEFLEQSNRTQADVLMAMNNATNAYNNMSNSVSSGFQAVAAKEGQAWREVTYSQILDAWTKKTEGNETEWKNLTEQFSQVDWKSVEISLKNRDRAESEYDHDSNLGVLSAARVVASKILADQGITEKNTKAYSAYAENISKQIAADIKQGEYQLLDITSNNALTTSEKTLVQKYLEEYMGVKNAGQFKSEDGNILYKGEGDTEYQHVSRSTINAWYAEDQISQRMALYQANANASWDEYSKQSNFGKTMAEAAIHIKEFGTVSGASAHSVQQLYNNTDKWNEAFTKDITDPAKLEEAREKAEAEYQKVGKIFDFVGQGDNQIISKGVLQNVSLGTLETFVNSVAKDADNVGGDYDNIKGLFDAVQTAAGGVQDNEELAKIFTALSTLDFNGNEHLNLLNIKSILENLGYSVDEGSLPIIYDWLCKIVGLTPGDTPKNNNDKLMSYQDALNKIAPDKAVDKATMEAAVLAGLSQEDFIEDTDGNFVYKGTQENIDNAKTSNNIAMGNEYAQQWADKKTHDAYVSAGAKSSYGDVNAFTNATEGKNTHVGQEDIIGKAVTSEAAKYYLESAGLTYDPNTNMYVDKDGNSYDYNTQEGKTALTSYLQTQAAEGNLTNWYYKDEENGEVRKQNQLTPEQFFSAMELGVSDGQVLGTKDIYDAGEGAEREAAVLQNFLKSQGLIYNENTGKWTTESGEEVTDFTPYWEKYNAMGEDPKMNFSEVASAGEMMNAVNAGAYGFADENGIITGEALAHMELYADSSSNTRAAYDKLVAAQSSEEYQKYLQAKKAWNDANAILESDTASKQDKLLAQRDKDWAEQDMDRYSDSMDAVEEAQRQFDLAQAIDAVAAARGLDAEAIAFHAEQIQKTMSDDDKKKMTGEQLATMAANMTEQQQAVTNLNKAWSELSKTLSGKELTLDKGKGLKELAGYLDGLTNSTHFAKLSFDELNKGYEKFLKDGGDMSKVLAGDRKEITKLARAMSNITEQQFDWAESQRDTNYEMANGAKVADTYQGALDIIDEGMGQLKSDYDGGFLTGDDFIDGQGTLDSVKQAWLDIYNSCRAGGASVQEAMAQAAAETGLEGHITQGDASESTENEGSEGTAVGVKYIEDDCHGFTSHIPVIITESIPSTVTSSPTMDNLELVPKGDAPKGAPAKGGGGGGGGKKPKKVARTRRSQVVKRYKNIDAKRSTNQNRRDNLSKKTDKLYGESRITNLQKENKLLEEGLKLNEKKAEEALKNLKVDEESLRTMTKKYGYELELDSEGNIKNYEDILGDIYDEIHKLELDGELSEEEEKIKEELEIKKQEIEGAMEDWEDTLKQLEELNNEYEELIDEMHSNELEQITYKLEFELELNELDTEWLNFLTERIGDDFTRASESMDLIIDKIKIVKNNIELYKKSIDDLMLNIQNDADRSLITGYLEDGVLTDEEAEILRDKGYGGLLEEFNKLAELKASAEELLVSVLDGYKNRIDLNVTSLEHYTSLMEHFGNVVDIVGQKQLGLSDKFIENMAKMRIQQSRDVMAVAQSELATYEQDRIIAETNLQKAREANDADSIAFWQEQLDTANTMIQEARDKLVTSFEDNLNAIADAFDKAVERIVQTFNDAIYAFGGLEGLSEDYSFIRENTELMAQDYEKIYELSKLNRNINKTLNDNNIIAGKQKMIELQKEINDLQASGAELSKYDLEYLQAKYELRLAEIELENAQNAKETVRLSKDSEGNWSYVYTASTEKIDEAQQKYEDALYKMQNLSYEYIDEMSEKIISASQAMMEEIQNLNKNNFENEQEYLEEINRIKAKYAESLGVTEEELNKALANNEELYDKDWQSYSNKTGYAISESQIWIDRYAESTLGTLMKSTSDVADYMNNFSLALDELTNSLYRVAGDYYNGIDDAFAAAGITKEDFASFVTTNTKAIMDASTKAREDAKTQAEILKKEYDFLAGQISNVQLDIKNTLGDYTPLLTEIRDILRESAALTKELQNKDATYTYKQAADLFNSKYGEDYKIEMDAEGRWNKTVEGVKNEILQKHAEAKTDEEKKHYADMYTWLTSYILPYVTSLDTGGYTGEWGSSGRLAMLHEKELILNANDTANFLDALNVSRELVNRVIEMNARASSFGIGGLSPSSIQDFAQNLEQQVTITAEFPNAVDHNEIEEAFASLINTASQYANRK